MEKPGTIKIDEIEYVRKDSILKPLELGEKRIIVADRGWVFVGDCSDNDDGSVTIRNTKNIRRWGTKKGLGELACGPLSGTIVDDYGTIKTNPLFSMAVERGW